MKRKAFILTIIAVFSLCGYPAMAQRNGHGGGQRATTSPRSTGFSGGHGSYSSPSRSSGYSSPSRSSGYSSPSRSTSYSSPSRSTSYSSPSSRSTSYSSPSRSTSYSSPSSRSSSYSSRYSGATAYKRTATPASTRTTSGTTTSLRGTRQSSGNAGITVTPAPTTKETPRSAGTPSSSSRGNVATPAPATRTATATVDGATRSGTPHQARQTGGPNPHHATTGSHHGGAPSHYATPSHPHGAMPHSHRHLRPAPYFHHPMHHRLVHCHPIYWDPMPFHAICWAGFWAYCHDYWYDYSVRDIVIVRNYVQENYGAELVTYVMSGDYMYAIVKGEDGNNLLQVFDKSDNLLAQQQINKKYCQMEVDKENGGCWVMKKKGKDPLLFFYNDGELLIYEED